ncbi:MAG: alpha/beta hydrolase fold protein [Clostridia bacterium]|jgi:alpha-beta hydrolase superfamily lysophospholipase|nr:alpha/beta hydrolase fold protein [Clostridia bacterium]
MVDSKNKTKIFTYIWDKVTEPKGIIQIFHGMAEHAKRYAHFASFLNEHGFIVYAQDHRGHGKTAHHLNALGHIGKDGFNGITEDAYAVTCHLKKKYPHLPVIILGHSFGSFVAQEYLTRHSYEIQGMILSGSGLQKGASITLGYFISTLQYHFTNPYKKDKLMHFLSFYGYNKRFHDSDLASRWLTSDLLEVEKYENDVYCGAIFPVHFYYYFLKGLKSLYTPQKLSQIRKDLPLLILSGTMDPVGHYGKSVRKLHRLYTNLGMQALTLKLFPSGRHEMLNESNRMEVYNSLLHWINQVIS